MTGINKDLLQCLNLMRDLQGGEVYLVKVLQVVKLKVRICYIRRWQKKYTSQLLESLKNEKYTHVLK